MSPYPLLDELEISVRAGRGVAVILEGESFEEDPWYYGQWFGNRAREVTFFPQDGWAQVFTAVAELRTRCPEVPVYGIIDRDFADDGALDADFAAGIVRTPLFTLENYLLDPECWAAVFRLIFRRQGGAPGGWDDAGQVANHISTAYRTCLDLAAHNLVVKHACTAYRNLAMQTPEPDRRYREHPDAFKQTPPAARLAAWGTSMDCPEPLDVRFAHEQARMAALGEQGWPTVVSGKHVLKVLQAQFPLLAGAGKFGLSHYLNLYLDRCPDPPADLAALIDRIVADAAVRG